MRKTRKELVGVGAATYICNSRPFVFFRQNARLHNYKKTRPSLLYNTSLKKKVYFYKRRWSYKLNLMLVGLVYILYFLLNCAKGRCVCSIRTVELFHSE